MRRTKKGKKAEGDGAKAVAAPVGEPGSFDALHTATASQELQWHLLAYRLDPGTTLSKTTTTSATQASSAPAAAAKTAKPAPQAKGKGAPVAKAATASPKPQGFAGLWGVAQGTLPPGHTITSWTSTGKTDSQAFHDLFSKPGTVPPGHTDKSWGDASSSALAPPPAAKKAADKAAAPAKAPEKKVEKTAAPAAPAAAAGPPDEAAIKAVGDEIRTLKEKLKGEGITGKKLNDHPDVVGLVGKLAELKKGGTAPAAEKKADPAPKAAAASGATGEARIKEVGDEIRVLKEKLKSEGVTGKKLNSHPEIERLVGVLQQLKAGS